MLKELFICYGDCFSAGVDVSDEQLRDFYAAFNRDDWWQHVSEDGEVFRLHTSSIVSFFVRPSSKVQ